MTEKEEFLAHYGVKGMKWGVRRDSNRRIRRQAGKDAKEFAAAKMYYGKGAGTRRKLIGAKVEAASKRSPEYKRAFETHLNNQDMGRHASRAVSKRNRTDRREAARQTSGAIARQITGSMGTRAAYVALAAGGVAFLRTPKGRRLQNSAMSKVNSAANDVMRMNGARKINNLLKDMVE